MYSAVFLLHYAIARACRSLRLAEALLVWASVSDFRATKIRVDVEARRIAKGREGGGQQMLAVPELGAPIDAV